MNNKTSESRFSQRAKWAEDQAISFLMHQAVENRDCLSLAAGLVDPESLPVELTRTLLSNLLEHDDRAQEVLQYGTTPGSAEVRQSMLQHLARLEGCSIAELNTDLDRIVLTTGSQQLLAILADVLFDPGDICLVAAPTYFVFLGVLNGVGATSISIETDQQGMVPEALESELQRLEEEQLLHRVKLVYLVSYFENPSGISLSESRREQILDIVQKWQAKQQLYILEDAAYRELQYEGESPASVWSFDTNHQTVILTQTFSKSFSPGLRVGFGVLPEELVKPVCDRKGNEDFGSANFNQHLLAEALRSGEYQNHVDRVKESYRFKRNAMLEGADRFLSHLPGVRWVHPNGGLYVWMTVPPEIETGFESQLFQRAIEEGVMYVPGELCFALINHSHACVTNHLRLSFGVQTPQNIMVGMERLSQAVESVL